VSKAKVDPAAETAAQFWTPEFVATISADVLQIRDLGADRELMLLACNLPFPEVRRSLHQVLVRHWEQGVAPFEKAKLTFESIRDPGFLVLAKSMPREEAKAPLRPGIASPKPTPEQAAKQAWLAASESFLRSLNGRFYTASRLKPPPVKAAGQAANGAPAEPGKVAEPGAGQGCGQWRTAAACRGVAVSAAPWGHRRGRVSPELAGGPAFRSQRKPSFAALRAG
jgi:hypothetical protein